MMHLPQFIASLSLREKFNVDVLWNVGSLVVLGVSGIVINILIAAYLGAEALGIFNQVFAIYIMLSQISVGGLHFSVLKNISHHERDRRNCTDIASSALILALILAGIVSAATYFLSDLAGAVLESPGVSAGLALAAPGLLFFSLNKILLNVLNAVRSMKAFAVFQALRFIFILLAVIALLAIDSPRENLAFSLTASEVLLFLLLIVYVHCRVLPLRVSAGVRNWFANHLSFGFLGFFSGVLSEMNTRVDVLMLGFFCHDAVVGIYSFAAIVAEGICQLPLVVRRNLDPLLGQCFAEHDQARIRRMASKVKKVVYCLMGAIGLTAVLAYPLVLTLFIPGSEFAASWAVFAILLAGIVLNSGFRPFLGILLQGGRPGMHTLLVLLVVGANILLNAMLIPVLGIIGAATATALVYVLEAFLIVAFARRLFGVKL